jgi:hypothetical protein
MCRQVALDEEFLLLPGSREFSHRLTHMASRRA